MKMKDSGIPWIGQIPEDWEVAKYKFFANFYNGNSIKDEEKKNFEEITNIPYISTKDIDKENSKIDYNNGLYIKEKNTDFKIAHKESCLICIEGGSAGKKIGFLTKNVAFVNKLCCVNSKTINNKFSYYILSSDYFNTNFNLLLSGLIGGVTVSQIKNINVAIPPQEIQRKIVEILDKNCGQIDELVRIEENEIEKLKEYKTSLITKVVTKGLDPNAKMKDSGIPWIGKIPEDWNVKRLKYIANSFLKGNGITKDDIVEEGDTPCVRYGDIYTKYEFKFNECKTKTNKDKISNLQYFTHGDILFTTTGELVEEIGKSVVYVGNKECLAGGDVVIMKHFQEPVFLGYALESNYAREQKSLGKLKLKVVHISIQDISNIYIALPSKKEQMIIAKYLDKRCEEIDNLIKIKQAKIEKLKEYKKSLIYQYVTGKKEIV